MLKDINFGSGWSMPSHFTEYNGKLYFIADDAENDYQLWVTDGTTTGTIKIPLPGNLSSNPLSGGGFKGFCVCNNTLYFGAAGYNYDGAELYKLDTYTGVEEVFVGDISVIRLYPNPTGDNIRLVFTLAKTLTININIYSIEGKKIFAFADNTLQAGEQDLNLNLPANLPAGVYMLNIQTENQDYNVRFIKE